MVCGKIAVALGFGRAALVLLFAVSGGAASEKLSYLTNLPFADVDLRRVQNDAHV